ncbi:ferredoxin--NADP reductase [Solirubrobacter soli]|uniref:ferredoxin--NADP reductase n=1 Tax=Solirubrobacter soli TaxID=363832 RepID=UPI000418A7F1|nr:hypothetical protein [Solirubrobacter soli]
MVFADALGFAATSLIALQVISSGKGSATTRAFGLRRILALHRLRASPCSSWSSRTSLIAAGIGITPALSVIRTAAEQGDTRPLLLLYGSRRQADVTFWDELRELQRRLPNLCVVHVLSRPTRGWIGERGRPSEPLLRRHAPSDVMDWSSLLCGPPAMVTELGEAVRRLGMPNSAIQVEGFS